VEEVKSKGGISTGVVVGIVILVAVVFGGGYIFGKKSSTIGSESSKTITSIISSSPERDAEVFQISHPNTLVIDQPLGSSPVQAVLYSYDRRDYTSYAIFDLESPETAGSSPEKYEAYLKEKLTGQNFTPGFTTKKFGNNTLYYFNGENPDESIKSAVLFLKNYTVRITHLPKATVVAYGGKTALFNEGIFNQIITSLKEL